jgi:uncharacterized protein YecE (DUF72 family)
MNVWIGTSGYSYAAWRGRFYPEKLSANKMLGFYSRHFPLVELNFTFYRPPTPVMLTRLADHTPETFQFVVKLPRSLSHERVPRDLPGFRKAAAALRQRGKLMGLLCQLPQSAHDTPDNRAWLETLGGELSDLGLAVEFRHRSWARPGLDQWLARYQLDPVSVDVPDIPALFPRGLVRSGTNLYVRLHSRNAAKWYDADKERYDFDYGDKELGEWADALGTAAPRAQRALVLFNNCWDGQAVVNAQRLRELLDSYGPALHVVDAPTQPGSAQGELFA